MEKELQKMSPSEKSRFFLALIEGFKERLRDSPDERLSDYCKEKGVEYRSVIEWTTRHGIRVRQIKAELFGTDSCPVSIPRPVTTSCCKK